MPDIIIIQRILTKYRKGVFDELKKEIDFVLLHSENKSGIRQITAPYAKKIKSFQYSGKNTNIYLNVFGYILKGRPKIVIHEFTLGIISLYPTFILTRLLGIKFILWGHGYNRRKGFNPDHSLLDKIRLYLMRKVDAIILYGDEAKSKLTKYIDNDKLFVAHNALNTNTLLRVRDGLEREGRGNVKKRIGFYHEYNLLFVGRIVKYKKPDLIIEMFQKYLGNKYGSTLGLHFVGGGAYLETLKDQAAKSGFDKNIFFHGEIYDDVKVGEFLFSSDLMVMPGLLGLAINHSFNFDCPVVTFQQQGHGPEIEYLIHEKTGFLIEEHSLKKMATTIDYYLSNRKIQKTMKENIRRMVENICSVNNFIKGYLAAINYVRL